MGENEGQESQIADVHVEDYPDGLKEATVTTTDGETESAIGADAEDATNKAVDKVT